MILLTSLFSAAGVAESDRTDSVRVAGIVLKWLRTDKEANYRRIEPMIREAAANGAKIVVTTECFLDGYAIADKAIPLDDYRALGEAIPEGRYFKKLAALAEELRIHLVAGMLEAGDVVPVIDRTYPVASTAEALDHIGKRHTQGKTVITI